MNAFILVPDPDFIALLLRLAPKFMKSPQFISMEVEETKIPTVVFSAFARFLEASVGDPTAKSECVKAIEHCVSTGDERLHNLIVTEVYEGFVSSEVSVSMLLPASRALYDKWAKR